MSSPWRERFPISAAPNLESIGKWKLAINNLERMNVENNSSISGLAAGSGHRLGAEKRRRLLQRSHQGHWTAYEDCGRLRVLGHQAWHWTDCGNRPDRQGSLHGMADQRQEIRQLSRCRQTVHLQARSRPGDQRL